MWDKESKLFYFKATTANTTRVFSYEASKKKAETEVVNVVENKADKTRIEFVRHHAFVPRFESFYDQWCLVIEPTYFFTMRIGPLHRPPPAGKKRLSDKSGSLRGQVIMWHRFLTNKEAHAHDLFASGNPEPRLRFGQPPSVTLATRVPRRCLGVRRRKQPRSILKTTY